MTGDGNGPMGLRASHQAAVLTAGDIALIRQVLTACSRVLDWAGQHAGPQYRDIADAAVQAAVGEHRGPGWLEYALCLAIDYLDFAPAAENPVTSEV